MGRPGSASARLARVAELGVLARNSGRILLGARLSDAQAATTLAADAEEALQDARARSGLPAGWALRDRLTTVADVAVVEVRDGSRLTAVLKLSRTPAGDGSLAQQRQVLQDLAADGRLESWHRLVPEVLAHGTVGPRAYTVERAVPGTVGTALPRSHGTDVTARHAVRAVTDLHRATGRAVEASPTVLDRLVDPALALLAAVPMLLGTGRRRRLVDRVRERLRTGLEGRTLWLARTHGDYFPGNIFHARTAEVTGIIDWGQAREDDAAVVDPMTYLLVERARRLDRGLGTVVRDLCEGAALSGPEAELLELHRSGCPADPLDLDVAALLAWLRHVENNLLKSPRYGAHPAWSLTTVERVLVAAGS